MSGADGLGSRPPSRVFGRRRRANVRGGRQLSHQVMVSEAEEARLVALANGQGVTVARLLLESALEGRETAAERRAAMVELFALRRLLSNAANNANQLARVANISGVVPGSAERVWGELRDVVARIERAIDGLSAQGVEVGEQA